MSGCMGKHLYPNKEMADDYVKFYNQDIYKSKDDKLASYYCNTHRSWHVGHIRSWEKMSPVERVNSLLDKEELHAEE